MEVLSNYIPEIVVAVLVVAKLLNKLTASWGEGSIFRRALKTVINFLDQWRHESVKDVPKILKKPKPTGADGTA